MTTARGPVRVALRARPGASRTHVGGEWAGRLVVAVTARAVDRAATQATLDAVAAAFGVRPRAVTMWRRDEPRQGRRRRRVPGGGRRATRRPARALTRHPAGTTLTAGPVRDRPGSERPRNPLCPRCGW
ncbi:DUF167 domain-containing protein [Actinotalea ferrariae]|uniref:DUF167 domain-containing protein n=1 Tax=Actinotalea ferrariae TaxID=1386098 RepID=UPI0027DF4C77|nr:DUF167 domain-containing protein [Actinotalea ferrariae]